MNILRLSTVALTIVLFTMGALILPVNTALAHCKSDRHNSRPGHDCGGEPGDGLIYTVELKGTAETAAPFDPFGHRGAFEFDGGAAEATLNSKGTMLTGNQNQDVTMTRPDGGYQNNESCAFGTADVQSACTVWNDVFNLCGLLGPWQAETGPDDGSGPTNLNTFTVKGGDWTVSKGGGKFWLSLEFAIHERYSDLTDRDLSASMQLTGACMDPVGDPSCVGDDDPFIPVVGTPTEIDITDASIHLRGKAGVTHQQFCHADDEMLNTNGSTLVITATATEN